MSGSSLQSDIFLVIILATVLIAAIFLLRYRSGRRFADVGRQVAALPVRIGGNGGLEVLVISTRGSGRWTIPKGWPMRGRSDAQAAVREAFEEAGVRGEVVPMPVGKFAYVKGRNGRRRLLVTVYRLDVTRQMRHWRERGQRTQRWLSAPAAADCVAWEGLADIIRSLELDSGASARTDGRNKNGMDTANG